MSESNNNTRTNNRSYGTAKTNLNIVTNNIDDLKDTLLYLLLAIDSSTSYEGLKSRVKEDYGELLDEYKRGLVGEEEEDFEEEEMKKIFLFILF